MKRFTLSTALLVLFATGAAAEDRIPATLFKNPGCKCCDWYADYLRSNGFDVSVIEEPNMSVIKQKYGVREELVQTRRDLRAVKHQLHKERKK